MELSLKSIRTELRGKSNKEKAKLLQRYFKTGAGEYAEGDRFVGVLVPDIRKIAKQFRDLNLKQIKELLKSGIHEERMAALLILVDKFRKADEQIRTRIFSLYLNNTGQINNWDLVDLTAPHIIGGFLAGRDKAVLYKLAKSKVLWKRRIAIMATFYFIRQNRFDDSMKLAHLLLTDKEDLIHKAVGWMLREIGKKDQAVEEKFLEQYYKIMPRTMLRYAIEKFPEAKRQKYLKGKI